MTQYTEPKDWNINQGYGDELTGLIHQVNEAAIIGDYKGWYNCLSVLFANVCGHKKMNPEIVKKIEEKMETCSKTMRSRDRQNLQAEIFQIKTDDIKRQLYNIQKLLLTEMHTAEIIFPLIKKDERLPIYR